MAWGISHLYKLIFIHIPKTAGTTICSTLPGSVLGDICKETGVIGGGHKSIMEIKASYPEEFKHYLKVTAVRNPFERFVSKFWHKDLKPLDTLPMIWNDKDTEALIDQLWWITDPKQPWKVRLPLHHPVTRGEWHFGTIVVDKIMRFERIDEDIKKLWEEVSLPGDAPTIMPHYRETNKRGPWRDYYTPEMKSLVAYMYREDLMRLNYTWEK